jgi:hypothetical protein
LKSLSRSRSFISNALGALKYLFLQLKYIYEGWLP